MRQVVIAITMCLALLACKTTEQALTESGKKPMTAANIKQLLGGKTVEGTSSRGFPFQVNYTADGKAKLKSNKYDETGTWWVEGDNKYCTKWPTLRDGKPGCRRLYDLDGKYQMIRMDGSESSTFTVR